MSESKQEAKRRRELLGGALCGFVNAQTTDEAYFPILTAIQQLELKKFSPSFIEDIRKVFPTIGNITPPPKDISEELKEIRSQEDEILSGLREGETGGALDWSCDRNDHSFEIMPKDAELSRCLALGLQLVDRQLFSPEDELMFQSMRFGTTRLSVSDPETLEILLEVIHHNSTIIEDIANLEKGWIRFNTIKLHNEIQTERRRIKGILDYLINSWLFGQAYWFEMLQENPDFALTMDVPSDVLKGKAKLIYPPMRESNRLTKCLKRYNDIPKPTIEFDQQDILKESYPFREEDYLSINLPLKWLDRVESDLAYCLIEFLIPEENRKHLGKCLNCLKYYIKSKRNDEQKFCRYNGNGCKDAWHNEERVKSGKAAKYMKKGRAEGKYQ